MLLFDHTFSKNGTKMTCSKSESCLGILAVASLKIDILVRILQDSLSNEWWVKIVQIYVILCVA